MFAPAVTDLWLRRPRGVHPYAARSTPPGTADAAVVVVDDEPLLGLPVQLLEVVDGPTVLRLVGEQADRLGLRGGDEVDARSLDVTWDDPDQLFYRPDGPDERPDERSGPTTRRLVARDAEAFAAFVAACPEADVDEAYVELDHAIVVGALVDDRLLSATSAYPWRGTGLGDIGVLTRPDARGRDLGTATVRAIASAVTAAGLEPQYRCDVANTASAALARAAGFRLFARWSLPVGP